MGILLAVQVTPANEQERAHVSTLAQAVQDVTGNHVELAYVESVGKVVFRPVTSCMSIIHRPDPRVQRAPRRCLGSSSTTMVDFTNRVYVDQGYTGTQPDLDAAAEGIHLEVVALADAKRGFVLLPRRWVVERSFAWLTKFRRLARDYERLSDTVAGLTFVAFACVMLHRVIPLLTQSP